MSTDQRTYRQVNSLFQHELDADGSTPVPGALRKDGSMISVYYNGPDQPSTPVLHPTPELEALALHIGYTQLEQGLLTPLQSVQSTDGMANSDIATAISEIWHNDLYDVPTLDDDSGQFTEPFERLYQSVVSSELSMAPGNPPNNPDARVLRLQWDPSWTLAMLSRRVRHYVLVAWGLVPYSYTLHSDDDTCCITRASAIGDLNNTLINTPDGPVKEAANRWADSL